MLALEFIDRIRRARAHLPRQSWDSLVAAVTSKDGFVAPGEANTMLRNVANREIAWLLQEGLESLENTTWAEIGAAMLAVDRVVTESKEMVSVIWTGPASGQFAARRTDQLLYDLLSQAKRRALIVTFAAHSIQRLMRELRGALGRGVQLTLLLETEDGSAGQLTRDALIAFSGLPLSQVEILHWPRSGRELNAAGRPGKLHAKCAVIDDTVVIGSANLTDDAFNRNMELGLAVNDPILAEMLIGHFGELEARKVLSRLGENEIRVT
jgi:phosphatidylserine/phosphatidylglycerophosphate/cardiolipin synthase-like enzyme